jgi:hypothetical protein
MKKILVNGIAAALIFAAGYLANGITQRTGDLLNRYERKIKYSAPLSQKEQKHLDDFITHQLKTTDDYRLRMAAINAAYAGLNGPNQDEVIAEEYSQIPRQQHARRGDVLRSLISESSRHDLLNIEMATGRQVVSEFSEEHPYTMLPVELELDVLDFTWEGRNDVFDYFNIDKK